MISHQPLKGVQVEVDQLLQQRFVASRLKFGRRHMPATQHAGPHLSRYRGRGMDFDESRIYFPGDDIRTMDWKVTARTGVAHSKVYKEERERPVFMLVDFGPSMFFGTQIAFKSVVAAQTAAILSWAAVAHGDRVGALIFSDAGHKEVKPAGGRRGVLRLLNLLANASKPSAPQASNPKLLADALQRMRRVSRPGSLIFILSDFYQLDNDVERHLSNLRQHNDVTACWIYDRLEASPPPPGRYAISNGLQKHMLDLSGKQASSNYQQRFDRHRHRIERIFRQCAIPHIFLCAGEDVVSALQQGFASSPPAR